MAELTELDLKILEFERDCSVPLEEKDRAIASELGLTATRYYQLLNELIDRPEALAADSMLVNRLRAQRARRQRIRSARTVVQDQQARGPEAGT